MGGRGLAWLGAAWRGEAGFIRRVLSDEERAGRSRSAIGGGTGVHPRERSCVRPIYIWGAAASLEPGEATRVGTVALAGGGRCGSPGRGRRRHRDSSAALPGRLRRRAPGGGGTRTSTLVVIDTPPGLRRPEGGQGRRPGRPRSRGDSRGRWSADQLMSASLSTCTLAQAAFLVRWRSRWRSACCSGTFIALILVQRTNGRDVREG